MHAHLVHDIAEALPDDGRGELYTGRKVQERQVRFAVGLNQSAGIDGFIMPDALPVKHAEEKIGHILR